MPAAFHRRVTAELDAAPLTVLDGELPADLAGHVLFQSLSLLDTDAGFSGDSLVWRLDLDGPVPRATSRLLRTADYELGRAFADTPLRFESRGMMRLGPLGIQNQTNTALVALDGNRLLATIDGGRPWELDPATLRPVGPVGRLDDYRPMAESPTFNRFLGPMTITTAHPPYDAETGEFYTVSLSIVPLPGMMYCEVLCWDGVGDLRRVPVFTQDGRPLFISQSAHQLALSRDHLVIVDTGSTIEFGKLLHHPHSPEAGEFRPPWPDTAVYVIDRDELRTTTGAATAARAVIPREVGHLMVDYDSPPGRVVLHVPHTSAMDFAEWIQPYDRHPATREPVRAELVDSPTPVSYDLGVIARYEIDAATGRVLERTALADDWTWGTGGLTARNPLRSLDTVGEVYHANSGFPTDLAIERAWTGFVDHPHRLVPVEEMPWSGVPSSLVRVDHDAERIVDGYFYPGDRFGWTPTFVPRGGTDSAADGGYVLTVVYGDHAGEHTAGTEFWVFDAADLSRGPIARLGRADLEVPLTLHSVWLDSTRSHRPDPRVDVAAELLGRAATWTLNPEVEALVRSEVLPAFEAARA
jgi:carotenoid cleavage dioxygenase-like enzyme